MLKSLRASAASILLTVLTLGLTVAGRRGMRWCRESLPAGELIY
jgi:hypothetical protein